ncbi:MAG TPA: imidazolonepropionase [Bacteroidia bacterium]|nr:imidazolonepropionase [Bacteroidia bacterium]HNU32754.1 imidazolonepropionase [Bacteroidia bacterium]
MSVLLNNIKTLYGIRDASVDKVAGADMKIFPSIENAFLLINKGVIESFGSMTDLKKESLNYIEEVNCAGKFVLPAFCDSHTHIVYAGSREAEYVDRINGLSYEEIALRGGGILNSAKKLNAATEDELYNAALARINECIAQGTGAIEIKSGYGLSIEGELKMLHVIKKLKENLPVPVKATFLGAHAFPQEYKSTPEKYIDVLIKDMMPVIEQEKLADYCDVFCERNYFTPAQTIRILEAGKKHGMKPKVHANQLSLSGGVQAGVQAGAVSVDHLEYVEEAEIIALQHSETMPTILPGAQIFLQLPHPPARKMIDAGLPLAIASDYNPGSSPTGNMSLMIALSCMLYKLTPEEAFNAATLNTAYAMDLQKTHGSIFKGKAANVMVTKAIPSLAYMPYSFGSNLVEQVFINGKRFNG